MAHDETPERRDGEPERGAFPGARATGTADSPSAEASPVTADGGGTGTSDPAPETATPGAGEAPRRPSPWARPDIDSARPDNGHPDNARPDGDAAGASPYPTSSYPTSSYPASSYPASDQQPTARENGPGDHSPGDADWLSEPAGESAAGPGRSSSPTERLPYPPPPGPGTGPAGSDSGGRYQLFSESEQHSGSVAGLSRRRLLVGGLALALVAALVGGGLGGLIGYQAAAHGGRLSVLDSPLPDADSAGDAGPVEQIAQNTLPSVVQLRVVNGRDASAGSGMIVSPDGLILTNNHVVASAATGGTLNVLFQDGRITPATIVGRSKTFDVAVVKAQNVSGLPPITLGNSDSVRVGQNVVAIGSPLGLGGTVTSGIVSALNRAVSVGSDEDEPDSPPPGGLPNLPGLPNPFQNSPNAPSPQTQIPVSNSETLNAIQTDASINPGNSGGPLVDIAGKVVGVNTAIASLATSGQGGSVGLGFAIPINQVKRIAEELEKTGKANRAVIGVKIETRPQTGPLAGTTQAAIVEVTPGGPAAQANLKNGDVITKIDQRPVDSADEVVAAVLSHAPGDRVTLTTGDGRTTELGLGSQPSD